MRNVTLLLIFFATAGAKATTPEFPIAAPSLAEAAFGQLDPDVASNGSDYFAIWRDERSSHESRGSVALYGSRIDQSGRLAEPFGVRIAENVYRASVASTGRGYLVAYSQYASGAKTLRVTDEGTATGVAVGISNDKFIYDLAANATGDGFLALVSDAGMATFAAVLLDAEGHATSTIDLGRMRDPSIVAVGRNFRIVDLKWSCDGVQPCTVVTRMTFINGSTHAVSEIVLGPQVSQWTRVNAIAVQDRIFVALLSDGSPELGPALRTVTTFIADVNGAVVVPARTIASLPASCYCGSWRPSLATDGKQILVAFPRMRTGDGVDSNAKLSAIRMRPDGTLVDTQPIDITSAIAFDLVAASSRDGLLLLAVEQRNQIQPYYYGPTDLFTRRARSIAELTSQQPADAVVQSIAVQFESAVAASGNRAIVAWRELDQPSAIKATSLIINSTATTPSVTIAPRSDRNQSGVSVSSTQDVALVTWREDNSTAVRILGKRMRLDGTVIDGTPIVISEQLQDYSRSGITSSATDGSQFFVVWNLEQEVYGARVLADGTVLDQHPIQVSRDHEERYHRRINPRVTWAGSAFVVVWGDDPVFPSIVSPPIPSQTIVRLARVTAAGSVIDAVDSRTLAQSFGPLADVSVAYNAGTIMIAWSGLWAASSGGQCSYALPLDSEANPSTAVAFGCENFVNSSDVAPEVTVTAAQKGFVAFWSANTLREVRGVSLSRAGITGEPFTVSTAGTDSWHAAAASSSFGTLVTYDRLAGELQTGGVSRVYGRVVDFATLPEKRRSIRR